MTRKYKTVYLRRAWNSVLLLVLAFAMEPVFARDLVLESLGSSFSSTDQQAIKLFNQRIQDYIKLRNKIKERIPKISRDSTPEQIQARKDGFEAEIRRARAAAKPGDIFAPDVADYFRRTISAEFKGQDRKELVRTIMEADTRGVPLRVNYPYPESKELSEVPPTLLLKVPELPKELKYRFVGRHMLLMDRESGIILDYILSALP